jgi:hypothetical protein
MRQQLLLIALIVTVKFNLASSTDQNENENKDIKENSPNLAYFTNSEDLRNHDHEEFRRSIKNDNEIEARRRSALDKGFMRFGRSKENLGIIRFGRSLNDNEMRPKRGNSNLMRFGRGFNDPELQEFYHEDSSEIYDDNDDFLQRPETRGDTKVKQSDEIGRNVLRLGRLDTENDDDDGMLDLYDARNFNKRAHNMIRFGRNPMRFGKRANPMRFGRSDSLFNRDARASTRNMLRLGRSNSNLMRFGRNEKVKKN